MDFEILLSVLTVIINVSAVILSYIAIRQSKVAIKQTEKNLAVSSNQFIFDRRLEQINYFNDIIIIVKSENFYLTEISEELKKNYKKSMTVDEALKQIRALISIRFFYFTAGNSLNKLNSFVNDFDDKNTKFDKLKWSNFRSIFFTMCESGDYIFMTKSLREKIGKTLTHYMLFMEQYIFLMDFLYRAKESFDIDLFFSEYEKMFEKIDQLKDYIERMDLDEINNQIKNELSVF